MSRRDTFWRQLDILPPEAWKDKTVTLIGLGGIGSPTAALLVKMGCLDMALYDYDTVERHNLPNQLVSYLDVGHSKVEAVGYILRILADDSENLYLAHKQVEYKDQELNGIVIAAVDSMSARKTIFEQVQAQAKFVDLFIDARIGGEMFTVYTVDPKKLADMEWYKNEALFSDEEALELPCTSRATMYNGFGIAAVIGSQVRKFLTGQEYYGRIIFDYVTMTLVTYRQGGKK